MDHKRSESIENNKYTQKKKKILKPFSGAALFSNTNYTTLHLHSTYICHMWPHILYVYVLQDIV